MRNGKFVVFYSAISVCAFVLSCLLFILDKIGCVHYSWWVITSPIWGVFCLFLFLYAVVLSTVVIKEKYQKYKNRKYITRPISD